MAGSGIVLSKMIAIVNHAHGTSILFFCLFLWLLIVHPSLGFTPTVLRSSTASSSHWRSSSSSSSSVQVPQAFGYKKTIADYYAYVYISVRHSSSVLCAGTVFTSSTSKREKLQTQEQQQHEKDPSLDDDGDNDSEADDNLINFETVQRLSEQAIYNSGTDHGLVALRQLKRLCRQRIPYEFKNSNEDIDHNDRNNQRMVFRIPRLLSNSTTTKVLKTVRVMESNGLLSTNPDSVDGLPSLHLNLISNGRPIVDDNDKNNDIDNFETGIQELISLIRPYLYENLLPDIRRRLQSPNIEINDVFLRRYGSDVCGEQKLERRGISAHYDVSSRVTAVIALDNVAATGQNGLYTTATTTTVQETSIVSQRSDVQDQKHDKQQTSYLQTSNHKALRRFFPLARGDCVVHTWDVLHGVDVEEGLDRTSLIVWFTESDNDGRANDSNDRNNRRNTDSTTSSGTVVSPWLLRNPNEIQSNDVLQFVLASALCAASPEDRSTALQQHTADTMSEADLYLKSASRRNTFALTQMGSLCQTDSFECEELQIQARNVLEKVRPFDQLPLPLKLCIDSCDDERLELAVRFWLEGSIGGSPLAQRSLGDELMFVASQRQDMDAGNQSITTLAAVLFALAAQQDDVSAHESLTRVVQYDLAAREVELQAEYEASPTVKVAKAAIDEEDEDNSEFDAEVCIDGDTGKEATSDRHTRDATSQSILSDEEGKFKIITCMSDSCCKKRKNLGMDPLSTFAALYERASGTSVKVEEGPCLGSCKFSPCVGIEHEEFLGFVSLEGMRDDEFRSKAFHNVVTEDDADRVWSTVENAIHVMIEENARHVDS